MTRAVEANRTRPARTAAAAKRLVDPAACIEHLEATGDQDSSNGEAHFRAGLVLKQIKAYPQAGKMLKRAVELSPKDPEALHQLAAVRALELVHGGITQQVVST